MGFLKNMFEGMKEKSRQKEHDMIVSYIENAEKGDRFSQFNLAKYYSGISKLSYTSSEEVGTDDKKAYEMFCSLARRRDPSSSYENFGAEAAYYAILHIIEGKGTPRNYMKAIHRLEDLTVHSNDIFYGAKKCKKEIFGLRDTFEKELKRNPGNSEAAYCLAYLYYNFCIDFAETAYDTSPEKFKEKALELSLRSKELGDKNAAYQAAIIKEDGEDLLKKTKIHAEFGTPAALNLMVQNMIKVQKNYEQGITYAEEYLQFEERYCYNREDTKFLMGFAYYMTDQYEKAEEMFNDTVILTPDIQTSDIVGESYNFLGMIYQHHKSNSQSDNSKALSYFEKSMKYGSLNGKKHYEELSKSIRD